jgi:hypothetical protein
MVDNPEVMIDGHFQQALDTWVQWENHLRVRHGYMECIHGEGQQCPADSVVSCDACAVTSSNKETSHAAKVNET